jgi:hypothetical protein
MSRGWWSLTWAAQNRVKHLQSTAGCLAGGGLSRRLHRIGLNINRVLQDVSRVVVSHMGCTE